MHAGLFIQVATKPGWAIKVQYGCFANFSLKYATLFQPMSLQQLEQMSFPDLNSMGPTAIHLGYLATHTSNTTLQLLIHKLF